MERNLVASRDETIDILKGFAIFCVVLGHINPITPIHNFIYSFHMALFIFLSGVTYWFSFERKRVSAEMDKKLVCAYVLKRFGSLIIPFLVWCEIKGIILEDEMNFLTNLAHNFSSYWFLPTLFGIILCCSLPKIVMRTKNPRQEFIFDMLILLLSGILCAFLLKITHVKLFRQILIYLLPFYFGLFIKKYPLISNIFSSHFAIGFSVITYLIVLPFYSVADTSFVSLTARFVTGLLFIVIAFNFVSQNHPNMSRIAKSWIASIGKSSLAIYLIQEFFRKIVTVQMYGGGGLWQDTILRMAIALCICLVGLLMCKICDMTIWLNFALFGKIKRG